MPPDRPATADARTKPAVIQRPREAKRPPSISVVTLSNYRDDPLYPRVVRATDEILKNGKVVRPIDVLIGMGLLTPAQIQDRRAGRVPYLEQVIAGNLKRLSRLRFAKTGDAKLEAVYATHFIWPGKKPFHGHAQENGT